MTDQPQAEFPELPPAAAEGERRKRVPRTPAETLTFAMVVYIFVNLLWGLPLAVVPTTFLDLIGLEPTIADELGGLRWFGAVLLAWAVSGILVLARPEGRAIFVTTGALQLSFAALVSLYTWSIDPDQWSLWYHLAGSSILGAGAIYLWWARFRGRSVFRGGGA